MYVSGDFFCAGWMLYLEKLVIFAAATPKVAVGTLTERLGIGLQNRVRRFESARYLQVKIRPKAGFFLGGTWKPFFNLLCKCAHFVRLAPYGRVTVTDRYCLR